MLQHSHTTCKEVSSWMNTDVSFLPFVNPPNKIHILLEQEREQLHEAQDRVSPSDQGFLGMSGVGETQDRPVCLPHSAGQWLGPAGVGAWTLPFAHCVALCQLIF